jgi:hypothetical protein
VSKRLVFVAVLTAAVLALAACAGQPVSATTTQGSSATVSGGSTASTGGSSVSTAASVPSTTPPQASTTESSAASGKPSDLLTAADVEKVSGLTSVKNVDRGAVTGAGGDVNFVDAAGQLVLMASFYDGAQFDALKQTPNYRQDLSGLGDAAFIGPSTDVMATLYEVGFKKGDHTVLLVTYFKSGSGAKETQLSMDQLKELVGIVLSRL